MMVPMNVNRFLNRAARLYPGKVAVVDQDGTFTYAEFHRRVQRLSNALRGLGVGPGDRVAVLAYNNHPLLEAYFGVVQFGAILVPLNIRLTVDDFRYILRDAAPKVLIFDADFEPVARALKADDPALELVAIQIASRADGYRDYEQWLTEAPDRYAGADDLDENGVAEIFYTSGTTGRPKGVALTHRNLYLHALQILPGSGYSDRTVYLHTIPLFHVNGWGTPHYLTAVAGTHVMLRKFVPATVLDLIQRHRVTAAAMVPTMVNMLLAVPDLDRYDLSSLERITVGGAPSPSSFVRRVMDTVAGTEYLGGYGLSEACPVVSFAHLKSTLDDADPEAKDRWRGSAGIPLVGVEVKLLGSDGEELPWDGRSVGELVVRGDNVMAGYWNQPEATAEVIRNGWLHTGDMATIDPEGYIRIVDRKKDIIISGGENISSTELEDVLYTHPAVYECVVVGKPDPKWGEVPHAVVVLKPGMTATAEELMAYVAARVAPFKVIKSVAFQDELPKTGTGKILKTVIRDQFRSAIFDA
jgi:fatty-acyl-CoA synthase